MARWHYYMGDAFTKIGGGFYAGGFVGLYYNAIVLRPELSSELQALNLIIFLLGTGAMLLGYFLMDHFREDVK